MQMYAIKAQDGRFYNGKAGTWKQNLSFEIGEVFLYRSRAEAKRKADKFNAYSSIHGFKFEIVSF